MMTHPTDILGYTYDADVHCVECTERAYPGSTDWRAEGYDPSAYVDSESNEIAPIFAGSESDVPEHCADCRAFLGTALTSDGYAYVVEALARANGDAEVLAVWYDAYSDAFDSDDWRELAEAWIRKHAALARAVTVLRGSTDAPNGSDGSVGHRYATVSFAFAHPSDADNAYRPFRKDGAE